MGFRFSTDQYRPCARAALRETAMKILSAYLADETNAFATAPTGQRGFSACGMLTPCIAA
jgi:hypothetical protein